MNTYRLYLQYIQIHTYVHIYTHTYTQYKYTTVHINTYTYKYIQTHTNTYKYIQTHTNTYKYIQIHTNTYKYIQTHTNTHKHILTHTTVVSVDRWSLHTHPGYTASTCAHIPLTSFLITSLRSANMSIRRDIPMGLSRITC